MRTCRKGICEIHQPTSLIFNSSVSLLGLLVIVSAFFIWREFRDKILTPIATLAGLGVLGVGLFPETAGLIHTVMSFIAFLFAGLSSIAAYRIERAPFTHISVMLGAITLMALILFALDFGLGPGGMERIIALPSAALRRRPRGPPDRVCPQI